MDANVLLGMRCRACRAKFCLTAAVLRWLVGCPFCGVLWKIEPTGSRS